MTKTVFVTGASGFIARHIVLALLKGGYRVRGSVRTAARGDHVRATMERHMDTTLGPDKLEFVELDLMNDEGWSDAMAGADVLMHTASPVPMAQPDDEEDVIRPAVDGTLRALGAACHAGIGRVILTSSVAAVSGEVPQARVVHMSDADWTDLDATGLSPYAKSKTLAELAAWEYVDRNKAVKLTAINPTFVFGPALDEDFGASLAIIRRVLKGRDKMLPRVSFSIADVRDVAALHVAAMEQDDTIGRRIIAGAGQLWMMELADVLRTEFPDRGIARRTAPNLLIRALALFDKPLRFILPALGRQTIYDTQPARALLGRDLITPEEAVRAAGRFMVDNGHV